MAFAGSDGHGLTRASPPARYGSRDPGGLPQICASGITIGSTVATSIKLFGFSALWWYLFPGTLGPWTAQHEGAAIIRNWVRLRFGPSGEPGRPIALTVVPQLDPSDDPAVTLPQFLFEVLGVVPPLLLVLLSSVVAARVVSVSLFAPPPSPSTGPSASHSGLGDALGRVAAATNRTPAPSAVQRRRPA